MKNKLIKKTIEASKLKITERNYEELELIATQALKIYPNNINFKCLNAIAKKNLNKEYFNQINEIENGCNNDFDLASTVGLFFIDLEEIELAKHFFRLAIEINPTKEDSWLNLGVCLRLEKNLKQSLKHIKKAYELNENNFTTLINLAGVYAESLEIDKSIRYLKKALKIEPNSSKANVDLGCSYYIKGKMKKGFKHYQYRFEEFENLKKVKEAFEKQDWKKWEGEKIKDCQKILFFSEQGIGDCINFIRFVQDFKKINQKVKFKIIIPSEADGLFSFEENEFMKDKDFDLKNLSGYDFYCSIIDIPYYLNISKKEIENKFKPYIFANKKCDYSYFENFFKIGICWAGNPKHSRDNERSCPLSFFKDIYKIPNVKLFSLQKELSSRIRPYEKKPVNLSDCNEIKIVNMSPHMKTWEDTASIIDGLDLVISVDTSILHLASAMGKQTFGLLPFFPDWRWGVLSDRSYLYPTLKLFRQKEAGNWNDVFLDVVNSIKKLSFD